MSQGEERVFSVCSEGALGVFQKSREKPGHSHLTESDTMSDELQDHPIASIFPLLNESELAELAEDIKANGVQVPIVLFEEKILDGRNRYRAARIAGVECPINYFHGESPTAHVISLNARRRQLTPSQKAAVATDALPYFEAEAKARMEAGVNQHSPKETFPEGSAGQARDKAAEATGANPRYVQDAKALKEEAPDIFEEVKQGKLTIPKAKKKVKERKAKEAATTAPAEKEQEPAYAPSNGLMFADNAISQLVKIQSNDTQRAKAFERVAQWLAKNK